MAIAYSLDLATPWSAQQVARALHHVARAEGLFDAAVTPELVLDEGAVTGLGTWIRVVESRAQAWNPVVTDLGFTPTAAVAFRLDKTEDLPGQQDGMVRLVSGLLGRVPGDAVLHFEFEVIWLLRRGGDLSINESADLWPPHRRALLTQPYRRATHAFSES